MRTPDGGENLCGPLKDESSSERCDRRDRDDPVEYNRRTLITSCLVIDQRNRVALLGPCLESSAGRLAERGRGLCIYLQFAVVSQ
jgi:hypothetical protein